MNPIIPLIASVVAPVIKTIIVENFGKWDSRVSYEYPMTLRTDALDIIANGDLSISEQQMEDKTICIEKAILSHQIILGEEVLITRVWAFKTPLWQQQLMDYIFHHQFVILELSINSKQIKFCTMEKNSERIWATFTDTLDEAKQFKPIQQGKYQKRIKSSSWQPEQIREIFIYADFFQLLRFLYESQQHRNSYHVTLSNCQHFCSKIVPFLEKHQLK